MAINRKRWRSLHYSHPCPNCGNRVEALVTVDGHGIFLQCVDCEERFSIPDAVRDRGVEAVIPDEPGGRVRPATREEIEQAGWDEAAFMSTRPGDR